MSVYITHDCINCSACETECPVHAVMPKLNDPGKHSLYLNNRYMAKNYQSFDHYYINPSVCNDCNGIFAAPRCNDVCPVSCCISSEECDTNEETKVKIKINQVSITKISLN
ncbi:MAG: 4Fe-4S dicluster domain-containing protein [Ignavibacteria bacterium]